MEGRQQFTITELLNKITFLRKALEFYADKNNYKHNNIDELFLPSIVDNDNGHQARFALEQSEGFDEYNKHLMNQYNEAINHIKQQMDEPILSVTDFVDQHQLNKINNVIKKYKQ